MALFENIFGGVGQYSGAIRQLERGYAGIRAAQDTGFADIINRFEAERAANAEVYSAAYRKAIDGYRGDTAQKIAAFKVQSQAARSQLEIGKEATLSLLQAQGSRNVARQTVAGISSGLGNTTLAAGRVNQVAAQSALQQGAAIEQYTNALANLQTYTAGQIAGMEQQGAGAIFQSDINQAQNAANQYMAYTMAIGQARDQQIMGNMQNQLTSIESRYASDIGRAVRNMQGGSAFGGALVSGVSQTIGQIIGSMFGPMGGQIGSQIGGSAASPFVAGA